MATYHVTTTGSDTGSGADAGANAMSAHRGCQQVGAAFLNPGDTVIWHAGTYTASTLYSSKFACKASGTAGGGDITMQVNSGDTVILTAATKENNQTSRPVLFHASASGDGNYVTWDGFTIDDHLTVQVNGSDHITLKNLHIDKGSVVGSTSGNYAGIWLQGATNITINNCRIDNVYYTGANATDPNAAGIITFDSSNITIQNVTSVGCNTPIYLKRAAQTVTIKYCYLVNALATNSGAIHIGDNTNPTCGACDVGPITIFQNIINGGATAGINLASLHAASPAMSQIVMYNNVIYNVKFALRWGNSSNITSSKFYNNICRVKAVNSGQWDAAPTGDVLADYNAYSEIGGGSINFIGQNGEVLDTWQARTSSTTDSGFLDKALADATITAAPSFTVAAPDNTAAATDFILTGGATHRNIGRTGGTSAGSLVNLGAYITDAETIGASFAAAADPGGDIPPMRVNLSENIYITLVV